MRFWASLKEQVLKGKDHIVDDAQWVWHNRSPANLFSSVANLFIRLFRSRAFRFVTNTGFHLFEEVLALQTALPTLVNNPHARQIMQSMWQLLEKDIFPLLMLHAITNRVQYLINNDDNQDVKNSVLFTLLMVGSYGIYDYNYKHQRNFRNGQTTLINNMGQALVQDVFPYVSFHIFVSQFDNYLANKAANQQEYWLLQTSYSSLRIMNQSVKLMYELKKILPSTVRDSVINAFASSAFNTNKTTSPPSLCIDKECNIQRKVKGMGRELGILLANEVLIFGISYIPYAGSLLSVGLTILNNGRFVVRSVTPERCERHKFMEQEFVLAIGGSNHFLNWYMMKVLAIYIGPLPALYLRILQHMLLQMHVNLAAHMYVPLVEPKDATFPDIFDYYECGWRFFFDVLWEGLLKVVPRVLKTQPGEIPFLSFSGVMNTIVRLLNSDLEKLEVANINRIGAPSLSTDTIKANNKIAANSLVQKCKNWIVPPMFLSSYNIMRDEIIGTYWKDIRAGGVEILTTIESYKKSKLVSIMSISPDTTATLLDYKFGIPIKVTKIILMLNKEEDIWRLIEALRAWFERHGIKKEERLAPPGRPLLPLRDDGSLLPSHQKAGVDIISGEQIVADKSIVVPAAEKLITTQEEKILSSIARNPVSLFSTAASRKKETVAARDLLFTEQEVVNGLS